MSSPRPEDGAGSTISAIEPDYITGEVSALIGCTGPAVEAPDPLDRSTIRRFAQAIMDDDPLYWDEEYATASRFGRIMAPPLLPLHAIRRPGGTPDPLDRAAEDPNYDGAGDVLVRLGLPPIPVPQTRLLNGGNDVLVSSLAGVGDIIVARSTIDDIYQKNGRTGTLIFADVRTTYWVKQTKVALLHSRQVFIWR